MSRSKINVPEAKEAMERFKMEAANEVGVPLKQGYNGELTSKQAGSIGGQMVNNMNPVRTMRFERHNRISKGHKVTVFDAMPKMGGMLRYGIPAFRLPKDVLDDFEYRHLVLKDIKVRPNTTIGGAITIDDLFSDGYKAVFVGTGVWQPNTLRIKGETLGNVHFGINYLNNLRKSKSFKKILIRK